MEGSSLLKSASREEAGEGTWLSLLSKLLGPSALLCRRSPHSSGVGPALVEPHPLPTPHPGAARGCWLVLSVVTAPRRAQRSARQSCQSSAFQLPLPSSHFTPHPPSGFSPASSLAKPESSGLHASVRTEWKRNKSSLLALQPPALAPWLCLSSYSGSGGSSSCRPSTSTLPQIHLLVLLGGIVPGSALYATSTSFPSAH